MDLGEFSVSLNVKSLATSRAFYEAFGFEAVGGDAAAHWLILRHQNVTIGLFQGMFENNILTFNPPDVRAVQRELKEAGIRFRLEADDDTGPAHAALEDPDGNHILLDQFKEQP